MRKIFLGVACLFAVAIKAQENMHPAPAQSSPVVIKNARIHIGNGQVIKQGYVLFEKGKITSIGAGEPQAPANAVVVDASGKQVYPGIIAASTNLGLVEVGAVRASADYNELGDLNPGIRSLVAYNTDSKVINTLRSNGVLLANIVPKGGTISGTSSVVQLDAWNWEDAAYKTDNCIHLNMPPLINRPNQFRHRGSDQVDLVKQGLEKIEGVRKFFREARAYNSELIHTATNLKFEAVKGLFDQRQSFFVHCDLVKEMMVAIDLAKEFGFRLVIVGGGDSWIIADILKENNAAVILSEPHSLPATDDDDVDQPCTMAAYGLSKEEALTAITLNAAKILGIDALTGSLDIGKDANIVISEGDLLDMKSSKVTKAFIQGREINLDNKQTQLFERYKYKYSIK